MARYDDDWCAALASAVADAPTIDGTPMRVLYVVTDTDEGKAAFVVGTAPDGPITVTAGKLPRGEKADITVTLKEPVALELWTGGRTRDAAFMRGDVKVEGAYERWLDQLVPAFSGPEWSAAWEAAAAA